MENTDSGDNEEKPGQRPGDNWRVRLVGYVKRKRYERRTKKEQESPQDRATRRAGNATVWIAFFTFVLAATSGYQFVIFSSQLDVMRSQQRAWINATGVQFFTVVGQPVIFTVVMKNTGQSLAKNTSGKFRAEILDANGEPTFDYSEKRVTGGWEGNVIFKNDFFPLQITPLTKARGTETTESTVWTESMDRRFKNREIWISGHGVVVYDDIFKRKHWMHLCFEHSFKAQDVLYTDLPGTKACSDYNNTDD